MNEQKTIYERSIEDIYLDFINNFLTIQAMANYYKVSPNFLTWLIDNGRIAHRYKHFCKVAKNWVR